MFTLYWHIGRSRKGERLEKTPQRAFLLIHLIGIRKTFRERGKWEEGKRGTNKIWNGGKTAVQSK